MGRRVRISRAITQKGHLPRRYAQTSCTAQAQQAAGNSAKCLGEPGMGQTGRKAPDEANASTAGIRAGPAVPGRGLIGLRIIAAVVAGGAHRPNVQRRGQRKTDIINGMPH